MSVVRRTDRSRWAPVSPNELMDQIAFLESAEVEVEGRMPWSSNATFAVFMRVDDVEHRAIYKPLRGERPLWDFEPGLHRRERAAWVLSEALRVGVVPPTILRDGPFGEGSFQWFVDADHSEHYFTIVEQRADLHARLRDIALFDFAANNTDRKSGHCLLADDGVWAIDNGLCFAAPFKLRTVIWEFAGEPISTDRVHDLAALSDDPGDELRSLLADDEIEALRRRCGELAESGVLPADDTGGQRYPWPLV